VDFCLTDGRGEVFQPDVESAQIETAGRLRASLLLRGSLRSEAGRRAFQFRLRATVFSGLARVRLEPMVVVDAESGMLHRIRELRLSLLLPARPQRVRIGGEPGWEGAPGPRVRLLQRDDAHYVFQGAHGEGGRAPGWAEVADRGGAVAVALREFWQQWPKSLEALPDGLAVGLLPRFEAGEFDHMGPWYKHQYLFEGDCYRLRTGQARRWEVWVDLAGDGAPLARSANAPLVPAAEPTQALATGVWGRIAPAGVPDMADYDPWVEGLFRSYCAAIENERDYGAMNWGDWFGERKVNWGNLEYDAPSQLLVQFARTADPRYFYVADAAVRHMCEVDVVHHINDDLASYFRATIEIQGYPPRPGMVHQHAVGHVGGFYSIETIRKLYVEMGVGHGENPYLCLDPSNLGHIWTQGMARHYLLTGDPFVKETLEMIGGNLARLVEDWQYPFMGHDHCGRTAGWSLLALAGVYEVGLDERCLRAMRRIVDAALAEQDPNCGGWLYPLPEGHCNCKTRKHVGMAGFITAILINGLSRYYELTGDERLPEAIERAVTFLNNDTWHEEWASWRYTSCPGTAKPGSRPGVTINALVNSVRITGNPEHRRILTLAWNAKFRSFLEAPRERIGGKGFASTLYGCPEAAALLAPGNAERAREDTEETKR